MDTSDAVKKAREFRAAGRTEEQITATLVNLGVSEDNVAGIIEESKKEPAKPQIKEKAEELKKPQQKKKKSWWPF